MAKKIFEQVELTVFKDFSGIYFFEGLTEEPTHKFCNTMSGHFIN
jgi:hypothetical protein